MRMTTLRVCLMLGLIGCLNWAVLAAPVRLPKYDECEIKSRYDQFLLELDYVAVATDYPKVIKDLLSGNSDRQITAVKMLSESADPRVIPWLVPFLDAEDSSLRIWAGCSIYKVIASWAYKRRDLSQLDRTVLLPLRDGEMDLRAYAWIALKMFRKPDDGNTHAYAARITRYLEVKEFEDKLRRCLNSRHPAVSNRAKWALQALGFDVDDANQGYGEQTMVPKDIATLLEERMSAAREQRSYGEHKINVEEYGTDLLPFLEQYLNDDSGRVRREAYVLLKRVGESSDREQVRQEIVYKLLEGLNDDEGVVRGNTARWLQSFSAGDFSAASKRFLSEKLRTLSEEQSSPAVGIVLLIGVADIKSELPSLALILKENENRFDSEGWDRSMAWAALKARARMGVKEDIKRCIELVEARPEKDRVMFLLQDLSYVRQPEVVEYLRNYLNSNKTIPPSGCTPGLIYADRAASALREMLLGFPPAATVREFRKEHPAWHPDRYSHFVSARKEQYRQWMREQKEWNLHR